MCLAGRFDHRRRIHVAHACNVLAHGTREQLDILGEIPHIGPQAFPGPARNVGAVKTHDAHCGFPEPDDKPCEGRFSGGTGADNSKRLSRWHLEGNLLDDGPVLAAEPENDTFHAYGAARGRKFCRRFDLGSRFQ